MKGTIIKRIITGCLLLAGGVLPALAQNFKGMSALQDFASEGQSAGKYFVNIAFVFCGLVGAAMLIPAAIKWFKGNEQSKDAFTSIGLGLIAIFVLLAIIKAVWAFT